MVRKFKGNSIEKYVSDYCVLDLETTSRYADRAKIIEIGIIRVRDNKVVDEYDVLVNPNCSIPKKATAVNHITDDMVKDAPFIDDVINDVLDFVGDDIIVGYNNSRFDMNVMYDICKSLEVRHFTNDYIDVLNVANNYIHDVKSHSLEMVSKYYGLDTQGEHRSLKDCLLTKECYEHIYNEFGDKAFVKKSRKKRNYEKNLEFENKNYNPLLDSLCSNDVIESISGKHVVITGDFDYGDKRQVGELIEIAGGFFDKSVKKVTDYVVIGNKGSKAWINSNCGTKVENAIKMNKNGSDIKIVRENVFITSMKELIKECPSNDWQERINEMLDKLIIEYDLPKGSLYLTQNYGQKEKNTVISHSICIWEPDYPKAKNEVKEKNKIVLTIRINLHELIFNQKQENDLHEYLPEDAYLIEQTKTDKNVGSIRVRISEMSPNFVNYIKKHTEYCIVNYKSKASNFGCCSLCHKCSDAKKCLHENKLYSTACSYRKNLEEGRIFYGKNKNID